MVMVLLAGTVSAAPHGAGSKDVAAKGATEGRTSDDAQSKKVSSSDADEEESSEEDAEEDDDDGG